MSWQLGASYHPNMHSYSVLGSSSKLQCSSNMWFVQPSTPKLRSIQSLAAFRAPSKQLKTGYSSRRGLEVRRIPPFHSDHCFQTQQSLNALPSQTFRRSKQPYSILHHLIPRNSPYGTSLAYQLKTPCCPADVTHSPITISLAPSTFQ